MSKNTRKLAFRLARRPVQKLSDPPRATKYLFFFDAQHSPNDRVTKKTGTFSRGSDATFRAEV